MTHHLGDEAGDGPGPLVAIVALTINQCAQTLRFLESLRAVAGPRYRVLLWDNGSVDGTAERVAARFPEVEVHHSPVNLGAAGGRNAAAALAGRLFRPSHFLFIDNDTVVTPDFLQPMLEAFADPTVGQVAAKIRLLQDPTRLEAVGCRLDLAAGKSRSIGYDEVDQGQYDQEVDGLAATGCTMVRRDAFERVGGFDCRFDPYGLEDIDFSLRIKRAGYRVRIVPRSVIYHERTTLRGRKYSTFDKLNMTRNWLYMILRHGGVKDQATFLCRSLPSMVWHHVRHGSTIR